MNNYKNVEVKLHSSVFFFLRHLWIHGLLKLISIEESQYYQYVFII